MYHQTPMEPLGFAGSAPMSSPFVSSAPGLAHPIAPALPPRPCNTNTNNYGLGNSMGGTYGGYGSSFGGLGGAFGGLGGYTGMGGYGAGYGGGYGGFGSPYGGGYNRFGMNPYENMESRFIQMAEESSRPAFQSIESVVNAIGSVAMMLENTFIALTSSFRAILGVAENFGRLRSLFAQFWSTFAVFRSINWLIRKLLVMLGIRTEDEFKAWAEAALQMQSMSGDLQDTRQPESRASTWPILLFFGIVFSAPYIILKMLNGINNSIQEKLNDPSSWKNPMKAVAQFDFHANSPEEISFRANQIVTIAPQAVQGNLWNSGWLMASTDGKQAGLIPVNYVKVYRNTGTTNDQQSDAIQPIPPLPAIQMNIPNSNNNAPILKPQPLAPISEECPADTSVVTNLIRNGSTTNIDLEKAFDESCA